jgi:hypothetical protein
MLGVLPAPGAVLQELQPFLGVLLVLCRRIILSFTLAANQRDYFLHCLKPLQTHKTPSTRIDGQKRRGSFKSIHVTLEGIASDPKSTVRPRETDKG